MRVCTFYVILMALFLELLDEGGIEGNFCQTVVSLREDQTRTFSNLCCLKEGGGGGLRECVPVFCRGSDTLFGQVEHQLQIL